MAAFVEPHYSALWQGQGGHGNMTVVDKVPPEMLYLVDAHWYQFPPMSKCTTFDKTFNTNRTLMTSFS